MKIKRTKRGRPSKTEKYMIKILEAYLTENQVVLDTAIDKMYQFYVFYGIEPNWSIDKEGNISIESYEEMVKRL